MSALTHAQVEGRKRDALNAVAQNLGPSDLARKWGIGRHAARMFVERHLDRDTVRHLVQNGLSHRGADPEWKLGPRLELVDMCRKAGWTWDKIGAALGVSHVALFVMIKRHAPHGMAEAIEDFREDEAA
jgi:hypothetical protein